LQKALFRQSVEIFGGGKARDLKIPLNECDLGIRMRKQIIDGYVYRKMRISMHITPDLYKNSDFDIGSLTKSPTALLDRRFSEGINLASTGDI
jgi:hypothetical protein